MYWSKASGRNHVSRYGLPPAAPLASNDATEEELVHYLDVANALVDAADAKGHYGEKHAEEVQELAVRSAGSWRYPWASFGCCACRARP